MADRPISCVLDPERRFFRITQSKGKALASGGFGISLLDEQSDNRADCDDSKEYATQQSSKQNGQKAGFQQDCDVITESTNTTISSTQDDTLSPNTPSSRKATEILFVEEVVFLHMQGLLTATTVGDGTPMNTSQLFQLLPQMGISLAVYLTYSHLRSQDFRVLRHDPNRLAILRQQQQERQSTKDATVLCKQVRASIQNTPAPTIPNATDSSLKICWDVYNPSARFAKTHPGLPDFHVAATYYNVPTVTFSEIKDLIPKSIPLKIAVVSDSGTVVMFGVTDYGIPLWRRVNNH